MAFRQQNGLGLDGLPIGDVRMPSGGLLAAGKEGTDRMTAVSVLLPVTGDGEGLGNAVAALRAQTMPDFELLLLLNAAGEDTQAIARELAHADKRIRSVQIEGRGLAKALNTGLAIARHDLVARMDADDWCHPSRLERQLEFMRTRPDVAVLGTAFEGREAKGHDAGERIGVEHPPTDPGEVRWRLILGNVMCHGSVMMRREMVLKAGGYDPQIEKAQDYELWLRLSRAGLKIANLSDVLYRYSTSRFKRDEAQARFAARAMTSAWANLPGADEAVRDKLESLVADATWGGSPSRAALASVESLLTRTGPTREGMLAWWWCARAAGRLGLPLFEAVRLSRVREAGERIREAGVADVWLYGAGKHTRWLLNNSDELQLPVRGVIDDTRRGEALGSFVVQSPDELAAGDHVLLSSDAHEEQLWDRSLVLRARAVRVWRIYSAEIADSGARGNAAA